MISGFDLLALNLPAKNPQSLPALARGGVKSRAVAPLFTVHGIRFASRVTSGAD
jgi:hypothetical protein